MRAKVDNQEAIIQKLHSLVEVEAFNHNLLNSLPHSVDPITFNVITCRAISLGTIALHDFPQTIT